MSVLITKLKWIDPYHDKIHLNYLDIEPITIQLDESLMDHIISGSNQHPIHIHQLTPLSKTIIVKLIIEITKGYH